MHIMSCSAVGRIRRMSGPEVTDSNPKPLTQTLIRSLMNGEPDLVIKVIGIVHFAV